MFLHPQKLRDDSKFDYLIESTNKSITYCIFCVIPRSHSKQSNLMTATD